jgi:hypothetical protein
MKNKEVVLPVQWNHWSEQGEGVNFFMKLIFLKILA